MMLITFLSGFFLKKLKIFHDITKNMKWYWNELTKFSDDIIIFFKNLKIQNILHLKYTSSRYKIFKIFKMLLTQ